MRQQNGGQSDTPHGLPSSTPSFGTTDNWSLQALVELNRTVASLSSSVEALRGTVQELTKKEEATAEKVAGLDKKIYAATVIITIVIAIGGFFANKAIDFGLEMAKKNGSPEQTAQPATPAQRR